MITADEVNWAYRTFFDRRPESEDVLRHHMMLPCLADCVEAFLHSDEFRRRQAALAPVNQLDRAPPIRVESYLDNVDVTAMSERVAASWTNFGKTDPYWSVLVGERWRIGRMSDVEVLEAFYQTGFSDAERVDNWLARSGIVPDSDGICAEYGCGVGRVTAWLAQRFRRVRAFDISESHLQAAKQRMVRAKHKQY